jgi:hypothetical protein
VPEPRPLLLTAGTLLKERCLIIREMNRGGFGVVYLDCGKTPEGRPFLVMQYVPFDQTAQALGAAHDKRVRHRDLKPENIMLQALPGGEEHLCLIDFGIATIDVNFTLSQ